MAKKLSETSERVNINLPLTTELLRQIDWWRCNQPDLPNRSEAIRRMIGRVAPEADGSGV